MDKHSEWALNQVKEAVMFKPNEQDKEIVIDFLSKYTIPNTKYKTPVDIMAEELLRRLHARNYGIMKDATRLEKTYGKVNE